MGPGARCLSDGVGRGVQDKTRHWNSKVMFSVMDCDTVMLARCVWSCARVWGGVLRPLHFGGRPDATGGLSDAVHAIRV